MALSTRHAFNSTKSDGSDPTQVQPSHWNAEHTISLAAKRLIGRGTPSAGAAEEISIGTGLELTDGGVLNATGGGGGGATNLTSSATSTTVTVASDTGTDATLAAADASNAGVMTAADKTKLDGIAAGATAVTNSDIRAQVEAELVAGTNVTITASGTGATRQLTIAATGGGGGGGSSGLTVEVLGGVANGANTNFTFSTTPTTGVMVFVNGLLMTQTTDYTISGATVTFLAGAIPQTGDEVSGAYGTAIAGGGGGATNLTSSRTTTTVTVLSDTGTDATLAAADASNAGVMTAADKSKLDGVATGATANSSDATLLNRTNHTGSQAASTISDFDSATRAQVEAELVAGTNVTITASGTGATRQLTIAATGGGGGGVTSITAGDGLSGGTITTTGTVAVDATVARAGRVAAGNADRTGAATDRFVGFAGLTATRTYTLPAASAVPAGHSIFVSDEDGSTRPFCAIVINASGADTIEGSDHDELLEVPGASIVLTSNGVNGYYIAHKFPASIPQDGHFYARRFFAADQDMVLPTAGSIGAWRYTNATAVMLVAPAAIPNGDAWGMVGLVPGTAAGHYTALTYVNPGATRATPLGWSAATRVWIEARVYIPALPDATNDAVVKIGAITGLSTAGGGNRGVYFAIDRTATNPGNWQIICRNAALTLPTDYVDSGVAITAGAWIKLGIDITPGTSARFYINGTLAYTESTAAQVNNGTTADNWSYGGTAIWVAGATAAGSILIDRVRLGAIIKSANLR